MADGRVTWGANSAVEAVHVSLSDARAILSGQYSGRCAKRNAGDLPGELLANRTTAERKPRHHRAIHIMLPVPTRAPAWSHGANKPRQSTRRPTAPPRRVAGDRELDPAGAVPAGPALRGIGVQCLRAAVAAGKRVERITKRGARTNSAKTPGPVGRQAMRALMLGLFQGDELREGHGAGAAVSDRLGRSGDGRDFGGWLRLPDFLAFAALRMDAPPLHRRQRPS